MFVGGKRFGIHTNNTIKKTVMLKPSTRKDKFAGGYCTRCMTRRCRAFNYGDQDNPKGKKALKKTKMFKKRYQRDIKYEKEQIPIFIQIKD